MNISLLLERAARPGPGPEGPEQASYLIICGKELVAPYRSEETPSLQEGVLQPLPDSLPFITWQLLQFNPTERLSIPEALERVTNLLQKK